MPDEQKNSNIDVVNREDYNKVVESHNSLKMELERKEREFSELKNKTRTEEEKKAWEQSYSEVNKKLEELTSKIDKKEDKNKVAKGIVADQTNYGQEEKQQQIKSLLDKHIPTPKRAADSFASNFARFQYYKSPMTKEYTSQQIGMGLSLHAGAIAQNPSLVPSFARRERSDIIVNK